MIGPHLSADLLGRFARGAGSKDENLKTLRHLSSGCSECRTDIARIADLRPATTMEASSLDQAAIDRIVSRVRQRETELWLERADAPAHLVELLAQPLSQRATLVRNLKRFQTWGWCELLLSESYSRRFSDIEAGVALGELAVLAAECLDTAHYGEALVMDMRGLAYAYLANARRVASDLLGAEEAMSKAEALLAQSTGDPIHEACLFEMKANLRSAQRRFPEALRASKRAQAKYDLVGDQHKVGSVLVERAVVLTKMGEHQQAEALLQRSLELLDPARDPRLPLMTRGNLALCLTMAGRFGEALQALAGLHAAFVQLGDNLTALRVRWLEANAAAGLGESARAEALLREIHSGFVAAEIPYQVALVSLDLAVLYLEQGRTEEVKAIVHEIVSVFLALHIHREAYAAVILFQNAVATETATLALAKRLAQYLREAQANPGLSFRG